MATNFPTSLDTFTNPNSGNTLDSPSHSVQHSDINDAVEAIEAKLGVGSSTAGSATAGYALVNTSGGTTAYSLLGVSGLSSGTAVANTVLTANGSGAATFARTAQGLTLLIPSSVTVGSGTGTVSATGTVDFSGASSVSFNDVFSGTYRNYLVVFDITTATATSGLQMRMRVSGADNSNSEYRYNSITAADTSATIATSRSNGTNTLFDDIGRIDNGFGSSGFINFFSPFATNRTRIAGQSSGGQASDVNALRSYTGNLTVTTSYTGFTLIAASGNITGQASVFGYNA